MRISNTGQDYPVKGKLQCGSKNFLYILTCRKCERTAPNDAQYGGESGQTAVKRFSQHHGTITQACHEFSNKPVGEHFRQNGHSAADCVFTPVEEIKDLFIDMVITRDPKGIIIVMLIGIKLLTCVKTTFFLNIKLK